MAFSEALQIKRMPTLAETKRGTYTLPSSAPDSALWVRGGSPGYVSKSSISNTPKRARQAHWWPSGIPLYLNTLLIDLLWDHLGVGAPEAPQCLALTVLAEELVFNLDHAS